MPLNPIADTPEPLPQATARDEGDEPTLRPERIRREVVHADDPSRVSRTVQRAEAWPTPIDEIVPEKGNVVLPAAKARRSSHTPSRSHDVRALARPRLLVIDDERLVGDAIARALGEESDVEVMTDAQEAASVIAAGADYDLILCDLMMPVMTGMDLYAEVVRSAPRLAERIVFMTGGAYTARARAFLETIVNPCLEKPLDIGTLRSIIARAACQP